MTLPGFGTQRFAASAFGRGWRDIQAGTPRGRSREVRVHNGRSLTVALTPREE